MQCHTVYLYLETALHVSGGTATHHQEQNNCIYSIWYLSHRYCYLPLSWMSWNRFECALGGVRHPQHTQTGSNSPIQNTHFMFKNFFLILLFMREFGKVL
jgi:hypothetical protein